MLALLALLKPLLGEWILVLVFLSFRWFWTPRFAVLGFLGLRCRPFGCLIAWRLALSRLAAGCLTLWAAVKLVAANRQPLLLDSALAGQRFELRLYACTLVTLWTVQTLGTFLGIGLAGA